MKKSLKSIGEKSMSSLYQFVMAGLGLALLLSISLELSVLSACARWYVGYLRDPKRALEREP
jgi:hypothetical protein